MLLPLSSPRGLLFGVNFSFFYQPPRQLRDFPEFARTREKFFSGISCHDGRYDFSSHPDMKTDKKKPKIIIIGTGGTIVSSGAKASQMTGYAIENKSVRNIVEALPELSEVADYDVISFCNIGSSNMTLAIWLDLVRTINRLARSSEVDGFVITHGTDTLEETAFFLNLTVKTEKPVVLTGAMRPATALSADGPLNLLNATRLAAASKARGKGVLVCMNGTVHGARDVTKTHSVAVDTFASPNSGPLGYVISDEIDFLTESVKPHTVASEFSVNEETSPEDFPTVSVVLSYAAETDETLQNALTANHAGIVLDSFGNGTISRRTDAILEKYRKPEQIIVRASRTGSGVVTEGKTRWQEKGWIPSGTLSAQKSRILLLLGLQKYGPNLKELLRLFRTY